MFKEIETKRLILRRLKIKDYKDVFEYGSDKEVTKYVNWKTHKGLIDSKKYIEKEIDKHHNNDTVIWAIMLKENLKMIGTIDFMSINEKHKRGEIGAQLNRNYWSNGYMTEATLAVIDFGFKELGLNKIQARCYAPNVGSCKVLEKVGMTYEGLQRMHMYKNGEFYDLKRYSILKDEFYKK